MLYVSDETFRRLLLFGVIGIAGTSAHYLTLITLVELISADPVVATTVGFVIGATVNYVLNYRFTFKSTKPHLDTGPKFFLVAIATGLLNALLVYIGVHLVDINYLLTQVTATIAIFLVNFAISSIWTFREPNTV